MRQDLVLYFSSFALRSLIPCNSTNNSHKVRDPTRKSNFSPFPKKVPHLPFKNYCHNKLPLLMRICSISHCNRFFFKAKKKRRQLTVITEDKNIEIPRANTLLSFALPTYCSALCISIHVVFTIIQ